MLIALALAGCTKNPFHTRPSEDPRSAGGTYTDPVTAQLAVQNLYYACNERNIGNYARCLADSFVFAFDFLNLGQPGEATSWAHSEEARIADNIFRSLLLMRLSWTPSQADRENDSTAVYYRSYELVVVVAADPPETTRYAGEAVLYLSVGESFRWSVGRWEDRHRADRVNSWADLKWQYR